MIALISDDLDLAQESCYQVEMYVFICVYGYHIRVVALR